METIFLENLKEIKNNLSRLEQALNIKLSIKGRTATIDGTATAEYEAGLVFEAINFGFSVDKSLALINEDIIFKKINIKDYTRRKNLKDVKARIIGTEGRTKRTISSLANCEIIIKDSQVGIIADTRNMDEAITALTNLIRGSKQSNVYRYLEDLNRQNKQKTNEI